ncbi:MAG: glycosyltransferase family protein [Pseudomonadota bacterium]
MSAWAILQARMTSSRMPGKVLKEAGGRTLLAWVVRAVSKTPGIDAVCVAIPEGTAHDPIVAEANHIGATVARGSETDVLSRFHVAAQEVDASIIMRVTTDCPFSDPAINAKVLALIAEVGVDYACNNEPFSYPHGLDCEVFTREALVEAHHTATDPYDREHVTPWIKRAAHLTRRYLVGTGFPPADWRMTVDHPEDFEFFKKVVEVLGDRVSDHLAVAEFLEANESLHKLNCHLKQR